MTCPACGVAKDDFTFVEHCPAEPQRGASQYAILKCWRCRSEFAEPREAAPPDWYSGGKEFYGWRWEFDRFLEDICGLKGETLKVLEVGCGEGIVLEKLHSRCKSWGIDFNVEALRAAKLKGLRVFESLEVLKKQDPAIQFDVVAFFHFIEHLEEPLNFLTEVSGVLSPRGRVFCSIPNPDRYALKFQREDWDYPPHHLTRFTKMGVIRLFERAAFRVVKGLDQPLDVETLTQARRSTYKKLPFPKAVRETIKLPYFALFDFYARNARRGRTGQSYYIVARRRKVRIHEELEALIDHS